MKGFPWHLVVVAVIILSLAIFGAFFGGDPQ